MSIEVYLAYVLACVVIMIVPGPNVTMIIANAITHGTRAGLLNVAGTQLALVLVVGVVALGLATLVEAMGGWFEWLRLAGAAYLVWLGWKMLTAKSVSEADGRPPAPRGGFFLQGFLVSLSNPKTLVFFGAFIPQFLDPAGNHLAQTLLLGATFMAVAGVSDSLYAILIGGAKRQISARQAQRLSRASGGFLIGGGLWLALQRGR